MGRDGGRRAGVVSLMPRESAASAFPHPGCFERVFSVRRVRRCRERGNRSAEDQRTGASSRNRAARFPRSVVPVSISFVAFAPSTVKLFFSLACLAMRLLSFFRVLRALGGEDFPSPTLRPSLLNQSFRLHRLLHLGTRCDAVDIGLQIRPFAKVDFDARRPSQDGESYI